jgi:hypothetical protein
LYVDWAIEQGFGIIDANVPLALGGKEVGIKLPENPAFY